MLEGLLRAKPGSGGVVLGPMKYFPVVQTFEGPSNCLNHKKRAGVKFKVKPGSGGVVLGRIRSPSASPRFA